MKTSFCPEDFVTLTSIHDLEASEVNLDGNVLIFKYKDISRFDSVKRLNKDINNLDLEFHLEDLEDIVVSFRTHRSLIYSSNITLEGRDYSLVSYLSEKLNEELPLQNLDILVSWRNVSMVNEGKNGRTTFNLIISKVNFRWD